METEQIMARLLTEIKTSIQEMFAKMGSFQ
jgi:hypothetical protein